ncbi:MAG: Chloroplast import component protein (Tic20) [Syntrophorhabdus sp. PtaU1.Bin002]|nr:MAG: Chloroplast import component protein (Tic20) [Syntrophorhabdus sp. PtaB.Bin006]OPY60932.1 MAG: Chloroplast import component protein (Tic20) [Syntrophorhabdus sp. PtaU1.Bin002]
MEENNLGTSSTGINPTVAGLLCYLVGFVTGIIFLIIEKDNKFVRFHATQSVLTFGFLFVLQIVLPFIPFLGWALLWPLHIVTLVVWILLMMKAYKGEYYKLPIVGDMAEQKI